MIFILSLVLLFPAPHSRAGSMVSLKPEIPSETCDGHLKIQIPSKATEMETSC